MVDNAFQPTTITVGLGTAVTWNNNGNMAHTTTSNNGFFNTGSISPGGSDSLAFPNAGRYGYHCNFHGGMTGSVKVRMRKSGSRSNGWTVRWSSLSSDPSNRTFDVRIDRPGDGGFEAFKTNTSTRSAFFNPSRTGTYRFKSRTDIGNQSSGFSPVLPLSIS